MMIKPVRVPIKYVPHPEQRKFHDDRYKVRYRAIFAGAGSGKTFAGIFEALSWAFENPGSVGLIFEPTYDMLWKNVINQVLEHPNFFGTPLESNPLVHSFSRSKLMLKLNCPEPEGNKKSLLYTL